MRFLGRAPVRTSNGYQPLPSRDVAGREDSGAQTSPWPTPRDNGHEVAAPCALSREAVLVWLLECSEIDAVHLLTVLARTRPGLFAETAFVEDEPDGPLSHQYSSASLNGTPGGLMRKKTFLPKVIQIPARTERLTTGDLVADKPPIVQFATHIFYASESSERENVDIMRVGDLRYRSEVRCRTMMEGDVHAVEQVDEMVVFHPGESSQSVTLNLVNDDSFNNVSEFSMELVQEGVINATLEPYLSRARFKVLDDDVFPTNLYEDAIRANDWKRISRISLMFEYFKMNFCIQGQRYRTVKRFIAESVHNVYFLVQLFVQLFLVDQALVSTELVSEKRMQFLAIAVGALCIPFGLKHWVDYYRHTWGVGGLSRIFIQKSLIAKFLHYDPSTRAELRNGDLIMAVERDCVVLVHHGYMSMLRVAQHFGELACLLVFQVSAPLIFGHPVRLVPLIPHLLYPLMSISFLILRSSMTNRCLMELNDADNTVVDNLTQTVDNYRLIADYCRRPAFVERNVNGLVGYGQARRHASALMENNLYFLMWMSTLMVSGWVMGGGLWVMNGEMTLGMFLTTFRTFEKIGKAWTRIYMIMVDMQRSVPALERIVVMMNMKTDLPKRILLSHMYAEKTRKECETLIKLNVAAVSGPKPLPIDRLPLIVDSFSISFGTKDSDGKEQCVKIPGRVEIPQGQFVCFIGRRGEGKSTLIRVLGGAMLTELTDANSLMVFLPSHLRVLHVPADPCFFHGTLLENLRFGVDPNFHGEDGTLLRILSICYRLTLGEDVLHYLHSEAVMSWPDVLTITQMALLTYARALIANPDVLAAHKPTQAYDDTTAELLMKLLKEFVIQKGIEQEQSTWWMRRARTCVITSSKAVGLDICDKVIYISKERGYEFLNDENGRQLTLGPHFFA